MTFSYFVGIDHPGRLKELAFKTQFSSEEGR
jgi:hypothetical protein